MIHIYECNDKETPGRHWEVFKSVIGDPWGEEFLFDLVDEKDYQEYLDELHSEELDYAIHSDEEAYDGSFI